MFAAHSSLSFCLSVGRLSCRSWSRSDRVVCGSCGKSLLDAAWHFRNSRILFCHVRPSPNFKTSTVLKGPMRWNGTLPNSHTCHMQAHINCISSSYLYEEYECTHHQLTCCYVKVKVKVQLIHHQKNKSASDSNWALCVFHFEFIGKYSCSVL